MTPSKKLLNKSYYYVNTLTGKRELSTMTRYNALKYLKEYGVDISENSILDRRAVLSILILCAKYVDSKYRKEE